MAMNEAMKIKRLIIGVIPDMSINGLESMTVILLDYCDENVDNTYKWSCQRFQNLSLYEAVKVYNIDDNTNNIQNMFILIAYLLLSYTLFYFLNSNVNTCNITLIKQIKVK